MGYKKDDHGNEFLVYEASNGHTLAVCMVCAEISVLTEHHEHLPVPSVEGLAVLDAFYEHEAIDRIMGWTA